MDSLQVLQRVVANGPAMRVLGAVSASLRLWHPDVRRNPYPLYRRFLEKRLTRMRLFGGWMAARYDDVVRILREPSFSADRSEVDLMKAARRAAEGAPDFEHFLDHNLLMIDGSHHRRLRGLVAKAFTPRRVEGLRPRVQELVDELLERLEGKGEIDLVRELARPLPAIVIAEMMGVPAADRDRFLAWSDGMIEFLDPLSGRQGLDPPKHATRELADYLRVLLAERRREPRDDLLTAMIQAEEGDDTLSEAELIALASLLLVAGHETTTNLIGNAVLTLLRHPTERRRLQDDMSLLPSAVEECLRFEPPIQLTDRAVVEPVELAGVRLEPGMIVGALLAAANRDPEHFPDPDRFDVGRGENRHVAFGLGTHFCIGAPLARLEAEVALGGLLGRFPDLTGPTDPPGWRPSIVLRGPTELPLRLARATLRA